MSAVRPGRPEVRRQADRGRREGDKWLVMKKTGPLGIFPGLLALILQVQADRFTTEH